MYIHDYLIIYIYTGNGIFTIFYTDNCQFFLWGKECRSLIEILYYTDINLTYMYVLACEYCTQLRHC